MKNFVIIFILFFTYFFPAKGQQKDHVFKNVTIYEGLSQNSVVDVEEDGIGFIWFATQDGLNRFDGSEFLVFPKFFDDITTHEHTQLGKLAAYGHELWMITRGGNLEVLNFLTHKIKKIDHLGTEPIDIPHVSDLFFDKEGNLWIGTLNDGLYFYDIHKNKVLIYGEQELSDTQVSTVYQDHKENLWVLTKSGLNEIKSDKTAHYLENINTHVITEDSKGNMWVGTLSNGLFFKNHESSNFEQFLGFDEQSIPSDLIVEAIHVDNQDNLWVGTYGKGLYIFDLKDSSLVNLMPDIRNPFSIGFQDILSIYEDKKGGIWIGTDGGGVSYYEKQFNNFRRITNQNVSKDISIEQIRSIATDEDGKVWIGTSGQGLTLYEPKTRNFETIHFSPIHENINNPNRIVSLHADGEGDIWVGTQDNGLIILDRNTQTTKKWFFTESLQKENWIPDNTIWCIMENEKDQFWVGTRDAGLLLMDKNKGVVNSFIKTPKHQSKQDENSIRSIITINDSTLALGFEKVHGVQLFNKHTGEFKSVIHPKSEKMNGTGGGIKSLYYQNGWLWEGTAGSGLAITHLESGSTIYLDEENGLPNNMIYGFLPENDHTVWASSNRGIFKMNCAYDENHLEISEITSFSVADGLQSTEFNTGAFHLSEAGTMYFGGISGLNYFNPEQLVFPKNPHDVVITEVMVGNVPVERDTLITYLNNLKLRYFENSLSFAYTALDFISPDKSKYFYKLEGYDEDWIAAGSRNYTAYTNLLPGDYRFLVKSGNRLDEIAPLTSLAISIAFPFWLEWWFILSTLLLLLFILYGFYRYRINQVLQVQQVKNTISADLHDEIGSKLTNIQLLSVISKSNLNGSNLRVTLEKIDREAQLSAEALDEIVWNIKITDESLLDIVTRMRRYASEVLENDGINYETKVVPGFEGKRMSMKKRRELFLILKELLTNVRKHAKAQNVAIDVCHQDHGLVLRVRDDGVGFDVMTKTSRNGIRNIKYRMEKWGGKMTIDSQLGEGTTVKIWVPYDCSSLEQVFNFRGIFPNHSKSNIPHKGDLH